MARQYVSANRRIPTSPSDLAKALADPDTAAELFGGSPAAWTDFETQYAASSPLVSKMAEEQAQVMLQQQLQGAGGHQVPRGITGTAGNGGRNRCYNKRAPGVAVDDVLGGGEHQLARFFAAVNPANEVTAPIRAAIQSGMATIRNLSERNPSQGGFLVPENLRSDIYTLMLESAIVRGRARTIQMDSLRVPFPSVDDTSHSTSVYGGVVGAWAEEGAAITPSSPAFSRFILEARKMAFFTNIPNELIQDAGPMLTGWLHTQLPPAIAHFEELAFITGSGVGEPEGILNSPAAIRVPVGSTNTIVLTDVLKAYARIWPPSLKSPSLVWLCSPSAKAQLLQMALTTNSTTIAPPTWLTGMQAIESAPATLLGHPLIVSEKVPDCSSANTTTPGALSLVDLDFYVIGERSALQVAVSEQYAFAQDLTSYRILERLDARSWIRSALTPANGGSTLSPIVKIDTTATS